VFRHRDLGRNSGGISYPIMFRADSENWPLHDERGKSDSTAHALIAATDGVPQIAPGLLAWIHSAAECKLNHPLAGWATAMVRVVQSVSLSIADGLRFTLYCAQHPTVCPPD